MAPGNKNLCSAIGLNGMLVNPTKGKGYVEMIHHSRNVPIWLVLVSLLSLSGPAFSGVLKGPISGELGHSPSKDKKSLYSLAPDGAWDSRKSRVFIGLKNVKKAILPQLEKKGLRPDQILMEIDGGERTIEVPIQQSWISFSPNAPDRQTDVRIVFKKNGKEIHVTEPRLFERLDYPSVSPDNYATFPLPQLILPNSLVRKSGMDPDLVRLSAEIQHERINWTVRATANPILKKAFQDHGVSLKLCLQFDETHQLTGIRIFDKFDQNKEIPGKLDEIFLLGGAAFSWHFFDWDSEFVRRYTRFYDPKLSEQMGQFKLQTQDPKTGAIPRELRSNLTPYQRPYNVKMGEVTPNGDYYNPPLLGWSERQTVRWNPKYELQHLPELIEALRAQRAWLIKHHGVRDQSQRLIGFTWTNLGSGRDNAPRVLDEGGLGIDIISYYKMMLDQEREFNLILGHWKAAEEALKEANDIGKAINERYWNNRLGFYVDLVDKGHGIYAQDETLTLPGFWPAMAKVPNPSQLDRMIQENLNNPKRFGGGPFPPSVSKSSIHYHPSGQYWRGGGWPPDFIFLGDGLFENSRRKLASELHQTINRSMAMVSAAYRKGDSPAATLFHTPPLDEAEDMKKRGTVMEFYGLKKDSKGNDVPTWGRMFRPDGSLHLTRTRFAGWGAAEALESLRYVQGLDAVPAYAGPAQDLDRWVYFLLTDSLFSFHQVRNNPHLGRLANYVNSNPSASFRSVRQFLKKNGNPMLSQQLRFLSQGYLEVSPTFSPENKTEINQIVYDGIRFSLKIERLETDDHVRLTVVSPKKLRLHFIRNWITQGQESQATDDAQSWSSIFEIGGDQPTLDLHLVQIQPLPSQIATSK